MNKRKIIGIVAALVLLAGIGIGGKFMLDVRDYQKEMASMKITDVDLAQVQDGTYEGAYDADLIKVKVAVDVKNHRITDIRLLQHDNGKGGPAEAVIPEVVATQSLDVEAVSGATNSSKVILKSIERALEGAQN